MLYAPGCWPEVTLWKVNKMKLDIGVSTPTPQPVIRLRTKVLPPFGVTETAKHGGKDGIYNITPTTTLRNVQKPWTYLYLKQPFYSATNLRGLLTTLVVLQLREGNYRMRQMPHLSSGQNEEARKRLGERSALVNLFAPQSVSTSVHSRIVSSPRHAFKISRSELLTYDHQVRLAPSGGISHYNHFLFLISFYAT